MFEPASRELMRFTSPPKACSYLPQETASLEYRVHAVMGEREYRERLRRGWRRHGAHFFRPACPQCRQCVSLRVLAHEFEPSRSQRRILRRNQDIEVVMQAPEATEDHVRLYNAYHAEMHERKGWPSHVIDRDEYEQAFLIGIWPFAREMLYFQERRLVGVGLVDVVRDAISSIYFFHDPAWRRQAPGVYSILQELEYCRRTGRPHLYLGYWISACPSMSYKGDYRPHELLEEYVGESQEPRWRRA